MKKLEENKFELLNDLPTLTKGAVFYWDEEYMEYTNDKHSTTAYLFPPMVMLNEFWFKEI